MREGDEGLTSRFLSCSWFRTDSHPHLFQELHFLVKGVRGSVNFFLLTLFTNMISLEEEAEMYTRTACRRGMACHSATLSASGRLSPLCRHALKLTPDSGSWDASEDLQPPERNAVTLPSSWAGKDVGIKQRNEQERSPQKASSSFLLLLKTREAE